MKRRGRKREERREKREERREKREERRKEREGSRELNNQVRQRRQYFCVCVIVHSPFDLVPLFHR